MPWKTFNDDDYKQPRQPKLVREFFDCSWIFRESHKIFAQIKSGRWVEFLWPSQNIWTLSENRHMYCWPFQCPFLTYLVLATYLKNDPHHTALQAVSCLFLAFWDQIFDTRCSKLLSHSKVGLSLSAVSCLGVSHNYRNVANISKSLISDSIVTNKSVHKRNQFGFWVGCCQVKPSPFIGLIKLFWEYTLLIIRFFFLFCKWLKCLKSNTFLTRICLVEL